MSELDQDFESLAEQINAKLAEAAEKLREVNELRVQAGLQSLIFSQWERDDVYRRISREVEESDEASNPDFDVDEAIETKMEEYEAKYNAIDVSDLEEELGSAGWSTSSSYC